jgi:hypothetical protein
MSDRCYVSVTYREEDAEKFAELDFDYKSNNNGIITAESHEADYGYEDELHEIVAEDVPFWGFHSAGDNHHPSVFASLRRKMHIVPCDETATVTVHVYPILNSQYEHAEVDQDEMRSASEYFRAFYAVKSMFDSPARGVEQ